MEFKQTVLGLRRNNGWIELVDLVDDHAVAGFKSKGELLKYLDDLKEIVKQWPE